MKIRYAHTNIVAGDWKKLSAFYSSVFGLRPVPPQRDLRGEWVDTLTGIKNAHIEGEHLSLPGYEGTAPTLEIFSYGSFERGAKEVNAQGFAHIAFEVGDVEEALARVIKGGGGQLGGVVKTKYPGGVTASFVYAKDPEGNIIELQSWKK